MTSEPGDPDRRADDTAAAWRAVAIRTGHVAALLAATTLLVVAVFQPLEVHLGRIEPPGGVFVGMAVVAGLATVLSAVLLGRGRPGKRPAGAFLACLGLVAVIIAIVDVPDPEPGSGIGLAAPLAALGGAWVVVAGALLVLPEARREAGFAAGRAAPVALVAVLAVAGGFAAALPGWAGAANTEATTSPAAAPGRAIPVLDGGQAWRVDDRSAPEESGPLRDSAGTAGGLLVASATGVRMLDPATGAERWRHLRYDAVYDRHDDRRFHGPRLGDDKDVTNVVVSADGRTAAVNMRRLPGLEPWLWIFDTVSGRLLGEAGGDRAVAIAGGLVLTTKDVGAEQHGRMSAVDFSGEPRWSYRLPGACRLDAAYDAPGERIAADVRCDRGYDDTPPFVLGLDAASGARAWRWQPPRPGPVTVRPGPDGVLLAHARVGNERNPEQALFALDAASGTVRWERTGLIVQPATFGVRGGDIWGYRSALVWAGDAPVLAEADLDQDDRFVLTGLDPATGETRWSRVLPDARLPVGSILHGTGIEGLLLGLDDGRVLVARFPDVEPGAPGADDLTIRALDASDGRTKNEVTVRSDFHGEARLLRTPATVVAADEGAGVALR